MGNDNNSLQAVKEYLDFARDIAEEGGARLIEGLNSERKISYKGRVDLVTEMDRENERLLVKRISEKYPSHDILAEEGSSKNTGSPYKWIIDPLDGTTNYAHGFGFFCVSVALWEKETGPLAAAVHAPFLRELYEAGRGSGAFLNGRSINVSRVDKIENALLATGFPYDVRESGDNIEHFKTFLMRARGVRRPGSAAIDLCQVAAGRFDGFWEIKLNPWDTAAGFLIVEEAGGKVSDFDGEVYDPYKKKILATNGHIHEEMKEVLSEK